MLRFRMPAGELRSLCRQLFRLFIARNTISIYGVVRVGKATEEQHDFTPRRSVSRSDAIRRAHEHRYKHAYRSEKSE